MQCDRSYCNWAVHFCIRTDVIKHAWNEAVFEELLVTRLVNKSPVFYEIRWFMPMLKKPCFGLCTNRIHSQYLSWFILILCLSPCTSVSPKCFIFLPSHPLWSPNNICWRVHMKLLTVQFSPSSCYFIWAPYILLSTVFPTQPVFSPACVRLNFACKVKR
jgi:hypothetical protein